MKKSAEWMTLRELGEVAGVTTETVRRWIKREDNPLPALTIERTWRVHNDDWMRWAKENSNTA